MMDVKRVLKRHADNDTIEYSKKSGPQAFMLTGKNILNIKYHYLCNPNARER